MPIAPMRDLLAAARDGGYAVGYFESWDFESLIPVIEAAEATASPVIVGFNGSFLGNPARRKKVDIRGFGRISRAIAEEAGVPVSLILNEADEIAMLDHAMEAGFNAVMYDGHESFEELVVITRRLVRRAHARGIDVEAEVGCLPSAGQTWQGEKGQLTDPEQAAYFAGETGLDAVAISVGNVHLRESGKSRLDLGLVERLRAAVDAPLVLHGGTGIDPEDLSKAIGLGVCKVNFGTVLKRTFINSLRAYFEHSVSQGPGAPHHQGPRADIDSRDPHEMLGKGGSLDLMEEAKAALAAEIAGLMGLLGCKGRSPPSRA